VEPNSYEKNVAAIAGMAKRMQKAGMGPVMPPRFKAVLEAQEKKIKVKLSKKKNEQEGANES
jgi:hypothetical protein